MNKYMKKVDKKSKKKSHNKSKKGGENILRQKVREVYSKLIAHGFVIEIEKDVYKGTELLEKYHEEGATFCDDESLIKFNLEHHELFLKVIGDEFFRKMNMTNEMFENYVADYLRKNSRINLYDLSNRAIIQFSKESDLTKDELGDLKAQPFFEAIFKIRISKFLETLTEFGLLTKSNQ